jgi:hypothetical protein
MVFFEGYTDGMGRVIFFRVCFVSKSVSNNIFFLLPMDLPTDKNLPMKDSLTEHFRR